MIGEWGVFSLILGFLLATLTGLLAWLEFYWHKMRFNIKPLIYGQGFFLTLSFVTLVICFMQNDFTLYYVSQHANSKLPWFYKLTAVWGGHEGSLLLWSWLLSLWTLLLSLQKNIGKQILKLALGTLSLLNAGLLFIILHASNPFSRLLPFPPNEGADLNPLLQDIGFIFHPPLLYMGYVGLGVPFALGIAVLAAKKEEFDWVTWVKPWISISWGLLTLGITLGSWWAYYELGWGGYWFWDPVENASLMPWLTTTALVHTLIMTKHWKPAKEWSLLLILVSFLLSLIGTFLVRSGVLSSVHAFASDPKRGIFILIFLTLVSLWSVYLYCKRVPEQPEKIGFGKVAWLFLGSILIMVGTLCVFLGTLYPLVIQALNLPSLSIGPPYFNQVLGPIMIAVLILMLIVPYLSHQIKLSTLKKIGIGFIPFIVLIMMLSHYLNISLIQMSLILLGLLLFGANVRRMKTINLRKWRMGLGHLGISLLSLGIALSSLLSVERELRLNVGESLNINQYQLTFESIKDIQGSNYQGKEGHFLIKKDNKLISELFPQKRFFTAREMVMTETAISPGLIRDFYLALGEKFEDDSWSLRFYIKPFIRWIWMGGVFIALGALLSGFYAFKGKPNEFK